MVEILNKLTSPNVIKWVAAGLIAAVVASMTIFTELGKGKAFWVGIIMVVVGVAILYFFSGVPSAVPAGLIVAGGVVLANRYIVPNLPASLKTFGSDFHSGEHIHSMVG